MENEISDNIRVLSVRISDELERISKEPVGHVKSIDSLVYIGNWQDAIPRSIWVDKDLDSREVRSWGIIRTQAVHSSAVMLSLNKLLMDNLGYSNATVSKIIYILRLTRWVSLCSQLRSESGRFKGNIYAIHDAPISISDSIYLDKEYLSFVQQQISHKNKKISGLAISIWQKLDDSVKNNDGFLTPYSSHLVRSSINSLIGNFEDTEQNNHVYNLNVDEKNHVYNLNVDEKNHVYNLNVDEKNHVYNLNVDEKKYNSDKKQVVKEKNGALSKNEDNHVYNLNVAPICSSSSSKDFVKKELKKKTTTTNPEGIYKNEVKKNNSLIYPKDFNKNEKKLAQMYIKDFEQDMAQNFLDETAAQIINRKKTNKTIRNPIGYLSWLCNEYKKGNLYLTSLYLKHQELRNREELTKREVDKKKQELIEAATNRRVVPVDKRKKSRVEELPFTDKEKKQRKKDRWGNLPRALRRKVEIND